MKQYNEQERYKQAKEEIMKIKSFYIHLAVYLIINLYMAIKIFVDYGPEAVGHSLMGLGFFWGIGLFFHWCKTFGKNLLFSKDWEKKKIKEMMKKTPDNEADRLR